MNNTIMRAGLSLLVLLVSAADASDPTIKCQQAKLKAQGKLKSCLAKSASGVLAGKVDGSATCHAKFGEALSKADQKAAAAGTSCRFMNNGDGTVSDLDSGLIWEKKDDLGGVHDKDNTYSWTTGSPYGPTGTVFTTFLYNLNGQTSNDGSNTVTSCFTGHCDWRLPTVQELQGILVAGCATDPCIDPTFGATRSDTHWTATTHSSAAGSVWFVSFYDGLVFYGNKSINVYVRAVRGGL